MQLHHLSVQAANHDLLIPKVTSMVRIVGIPLIVEHALELYLYGLDSSVAEHRTLFSKELPQLSGTQKHQIVQGICTQVLPSPKFDDYIRVLNCREIASCMSASIAWRA